MRTVAILLLFALAQSASAAERQLGNFLQFGTHDVGFRLLRDGALEVGVWYPAEAVSRRMKFGNYLSDRTGFEEFLAVAGVSPGTIAQYADAPMSAGRDAAPVLHRFPLVIVAQGNQQSFADQALLCEYLASHGYAVATTPSPMIASPLRSEQDIGAFAQTQAEELERAAAAVSREGLADPARIAVVGHSFGARAGLLLAMHDRRVRALVSLDGGIGTAVGVESTRRAPWFRNGAVPPILHLYETEDAFMKPDLSFLRGIGSQSLHTDRTLGLHHAHFATLGFAAAALPELLRLTRGPDDISAKLVYVAERTLRFVSTHIGSTR